MDTNLNLKDLTNQLMGFSFKSKSVYILWQVIYLCTLINDLSIHFEYIDNLPSQFRGFYYFETKQDLMFINENVYE